MAPLVDAYIYPADGALIPEPDVIAAICIVSVIWGNGLSFAVIPKFNEWVRVMTTASDVSDSNWRRKHLERAGYRERVLRNCRWVRA